MDTDPTTGPSWWHDAVGYEIYVRSFADSNGDGVGDLAGITSRLDHLVYLGVNLVWVTPFYPSPMADFGYDVSDYRGVDPIFGDLVDAEKLLAEAHERGLRVLIDLVPNHTSDQHRWFQQALADPHGPYRDYYIWRDPAPGGGPPNNWVSYFGGPAWTLDPASGQYYLHLFLPEQPDLDWRNPAVQREFEDILRYWLDRGVDGFRIDVAQGLVKHPELPDNPQVGPFDPTAGRLEQWEAFDHRYDVEQPETLDVFASWRALVAQYDALLVGETYVVDAAHLRRFLRPDGLQVGFWFKPMFIDWDPAQIRQVLQDPLEAGIDPRRIGWVSSSHDEVRPPTRFGGGDLGRRRALVLSTLLFSMPGLPVLYQGEELGLEEAVLPEDRRADPVGDDVADSRDGCRTPMPWEPGVAFGFSANPATWLPDGGRTDADTVSVQRATPGSWLRRYRELLAVRHREADLRGGEVEWLTRDGAVIGFRRGSLAVVANVGTTSAAVGVAGDVVYATEPEGETVAEPDRLAGNAAVIVRLGDGAGR